jgi:hypothetical protein
MASARRAKQALLHYEEISPADTEAFAKFYAIYSELFPLANEREPPEAFHEIAGLNTRADMQARFGPWREFVTGIRNGDGGPLVGGNIFGVTTSQAHVAFGCQASIQDIYLFLVPEARGRGAVADAQPYMESQALTAFGLDASTGKTAPLIFLEVNNPMRMTTVEIEQDTASSGFNPYQRYAFWKRQGYAPLDLRYVQPPLRPDASAVRYLDLFCTAGLADAIPAELIAAHLNAFISMSVLKGRAASGDPDFVRMTHDLKKERAVRFVPDTDSEQQTIAERAKFSPP